MKNLFFALVGALRERKVATALLSLVIALAAVVGFDLHTDEATITLITQIADAFFQLNEAAGE